MKFNLIGNKIINEMDTGAIETIELHRGHSMGGRIDFRNCNYCVYLFYDDTGRVIAREIDQPLAINLDGHKINELIEQKGKNNELGSKEIERTKIQKLLVSLGILAETPQGLAFNPEYQYHFLPDENIDVKVIDVDPADMLRGNNG